MPERPPGGAVRPHKCRPGSPGRRDAVRSPGYEAGRRRAIGVVAALPSTHARPRRWCDAGPPGRNSVPAAQKAGDEGVRNPRSHKTQYPALSRKRPAGFNNPDGQAGSPPPQSPPNLKENRDRGRWGHPENRAPPGCRVRICAGTTSRQSGPPSTNADRAPPGERDAVRSPGYEAGRRRAIGVVAALPATHARPRRWCDAGPPGRNSVPAAQKAGDEGVRNPRSHKTQYPALSRKRPAGFNNPDGQAGSPPPQSPPNLKENRDRGRWGPAENRAPPGCRVRICAGTTSRQSGPLRTNADRAPPGERDAVRSPGYEAGRRRAIGVVAALPSTYARPRRWCDAGPRSVRQKAGRG